MNNTFKTLKRFGLSQNEILVYLETLKSDELSPYQISKATKIPRTTVYDVLMGLALKGLVELEQSDGLQKQQTKVKAKNPSVLRAILQQKREESHKLEVDIAEILPELKGQFHKEESNANFKFYPGIFGVRYALEHFESMSDVPIDIVSWNQLLPLDAVGSEQINSWIKKNTEIRKNAGIRSKILVPLNNWTKHVITYQSSIDEDYLLTREYRYIDSSLFEFYLNFEISGDYIKMISTEADELWAVLMKSESLAKSLRSVFYLTWTIATPITKDLIKLWGENGFLKQQTKTKVKKLF